MNTKTKLLLLALFPLAMSLLFTAQSEIRETWAKPIRTYYCDEIYFGEKNTNSTELTCDFPTELHIQNAKGVYYEQGCALKITPYGRVKFKFDKILVRAIIVSRKWQEATETTYIENINNKHFTISTNNEILEITKIVLRIGEQSMKTEIKNITISFNGGKVSTVDLENNKFYHPEFEEN